MGNAQAMQSYSSTRKKCNLCLFENTMLCNQIPLFHDHDAKKQLLLYINYMGHVVKPMY